MLFTGDPRGTTKEENHIDELLGRILHNCKCTQAIIQCIPSHVGIAGNEIADKLADSLSKQTVINNKIILKDVINVFQQRANHETNT